MDIVFVQPNKSNSCGQCWSLHGKRVPAIGEDGNGDPACKRHKEQGGLVRKRYGIGGMQGRGVEND